MADAARPPRRIHGVDFGGAKDASRHGAAPRFRVGSGNPNLTHGAAWWPKREPTRNHPEVPRPMPTSRKRAACLPAGTAERRATGVRRAAGPPSGAWPASARSFPSGGWGRGGRPTEGTPPGGAGSDRALAHRCTARQLSRYVAAQTTHSARPLYPRLVLDLTGIKPLSVSLVHRRLEKFRDDAGGGRYFAGNPPFAVRSALPRNKQRRAVRSLRSSAGKSQFGALSGRRNRK